MSPLGGGYRWCLGKCSEAVGCSRRQDRSAVWSTQLRGSPPGAREKLDFLRTGRNVPPGPGCFPPGGRHREGLWQVSLNAERLRSTSAYGSRE